MGCALAKLSAAVSKLGKCTIDVCPSCAQYVFNDMTCKTEWCCCSTSMETRHTDLLTHAEI